MKKRIGKCMGILFLSTMLGIGYACFWSSTGLAFPCVFHAVTGLYCPGCGVSRMCLALLQLHWREAFSYNPLVFCLLPLFVLYGGREIGFYILGRKPRRPAWERWGTWVLVAAAVLFGIMRNLPMFSFLAPRL